MLHEILNPMSQSLLSARSISPIVPAGMRAGRRLERVCQTELKKPIPNALPGDGDSLEAFRRGTLQHLTALLSETISDRCIALAARDIHALLGIASWCDVSVGDPYRYDPCGADYAFAETACALAVCLNMLRRPLAEISPALPARIEAELSRRLLIPFSGNAPLPELSLQSYCLLLIAAILGGSGESVRWHVIQKMCRAIDQKLNHLPADGSMPGGIEYATDTTILLMDAAEIICAATDNRINLTQHERLLCMADYPLFAHLQAGWFVNPGEHPMQAAPDAESLFRFGQRASDTALCDLSAWMLRAGHERPAKQLITRLLNRRTLRALEETPGRIRLFRDGFLPDAGLMFMRGFNLHIAMTGATGTSHADAGNICLFRKEQPVLVDIGADARATDLHSLPTIDGIGQVAPTAPRLTECGDDGENTTCYTVNLTAAYPKECHISDYQRTLLMGSSSAPGIRLMDMLELTQPAPVNFHFICGCEPTPVADGVKIGPVLLQWSGELKPSIEPLPEYRLYRLTLHAEAAVRQQQMFEFIPD